MAHPIILNPGQQFGLWTVLGPAPKLNTFTTYLCQCACGQKRAIRAVQLCHGKSTRCHKCSHRKHGGTLGGKPSPEYTVWEAMRQRCQNPRHPEYANYGGRGIAVCPAWDDFSIFLREMGPRPSSSHSLEREDNNGPYAGSNCHWGTSHEQTRNMRVNRYFEFGGKRMVLSDWATELGIHHQTLRNRLKRGWPLDEALTLGKQPRSRR
jgi:hypothetical protein